MGEDKDSLEMDVCVAQRRCVCRGGGARLLDMCVWRGVCVCVEELGCQVHD